MKRNVLHIRKIDLGPVLSTTAKFLAMVERYLRKNKREKKRKKEKIPVIIKRTRAIRVEQEMI